MGRPQADASMRLRAKVWYYAVKKRQGLSDYRLGQLFSPVSSGGYRKRVFETIRKLGTFPSTGSHPKRNFDLVSRVDGHLGYAGTARIINSPFWKLIGPERLSLVEVRCLVVECIDLMGLATRSGNFIDDGRDEFAALVADDENVTLQNWIMFMQDGDMGYEQAMVQAFLHEQRSFEFVALFGALAIEASMAGAMHIAAGHVKTFISALDEFSSQPWLSEVRVDLLSLATSRIYDSVRPNSIEPVSYANLLSGINGVNLHSASAAFLERHHRLIWR